MTPYIVLVSAHPALIRILKPVARFAGALQPVTVGITKSAQSVWACIQCWQNVAYEPCKVSCCLDLFSATSFSSQFTRNTGTPVTFHQAVIYAPAHTTNMYIWYLHPMASYGCHLWGISKLSSGPLRKTWMTWLLPMLEAGPGWAWLPAPTCALFEQTENPTPASNRMWRMHKRSKLSEQGKSLTHWGVSLVRFARNQQLAQKISIQSIHIYINNTYICATNKMERSDKRAFVRS